MALLGMRSGRYKRGAVVGRICAWLLLVLPIGGTHLLAQSAPSPEYQVKAAFLFHFTQFAEWPPEAFAEAEQPFVIGVLGDDPFGSYLDETVLGEAVDTHAMVVRRYRRVEDVEACHILFISQSEADRLAQILTRLQDRAMLTVSDVPRFTERGGIIEFVMEDNKIRLRINVEAARAAEVTISAKLLRLADIVSPQTG